MSYFAALRGPADPDRLAGIAIELVRNRTPIPDASQLCAAELRHPNNCASAWRVQTQIADAAPFHLPLRGVAANTIFDGIRFSLWPYGCLNDRNSVRVAGLQLALA